MKNIYKIIAVIIAAALLIPGTVFAAEPAFVYELTDTDEYAPDRVIVTVREEYSGWNKHFSAGDFPEIPVTDIRYITPLFESEDEVPMLDTSHYKQVLLIIIDDAEMSVPDAIASLSANGIVLDASPDYIEHIEDEPIDSCLPGDVDCDRTLSAKDAALLVRSLSGWKVEISPLGADLADLNGNGQLDSVDLAIIMKALAGYSMSSLLAKYI